MYVYILHSELLNKYYVGHSKNIDDRLEFHNKGYGKYTKKGIPWSLIWTFECENRSEAMKLEKKIKKRGISRFLNDFRGV